MQELKIEDLDDFYEKDASQSCQHYKKDTGFDSHRVETHSPCLSVTSQRRKNNGKINGKES